MTSRLTRDIFITKDAIWDDMLPPLLILFKYELGSWTKFISWNFLYQRTCLSWRTLFETVCCFFYLFCLRKKKLCKLEIDPWLLMTQSSNPDKIRLRRKICFKDPQVVLNIVTLDKDKGNFCFTSRVRERKADKNVNWMTVVGKNMKISHALRWIVSFLLGLKKRKEECL